MKLHVIQNTKTGLLFNCTMGWVDSQNMDVFSDDEKREYSLPIEGAWKELAGR